MAVTEALMSLFLKELVSVDKVVSVAKRVAKTANGGDEETIPADQEEALLLWANVCCKALKAKAEAEIKQEQEVNNL